MQQWDVLIRSEEDLLLDNLLELDFIFRGQRL